MKKRVIPILIVLAALISLLVLPSNAAETSDSLQAGYAKITIDPSQCGDGITGLPMSGYGATSERLSGSKYYQETETSSGYLWNKTYSDSYAYADSPDSTATEYNRMDDDGSGTVGDAGDGLFACVIAMTDKSGNTILYIAVDLINADSGWTNALRTQVSATTGVPFDNIYINASHTHSGPDMSAQDDKSVTYRTWVYDQITTAANTALSDRAPVTVTKGSIDASDYLESTGLSGTQLHMNHVRHYKTKDTAGNYYYGGSNFGSFQHGTSSTSEMVYNPDDTLYLVKMEAAGKDPIVIVNWRAHATMNSTQQTQYGYENHYKISSDYVGSLRATLENSNYRFAFMQGAAGNAVPNSAVLAHQDPDVCGDYDSHYKTGGDAADDLDYPMGSKYGAKLGDIALAGLESMENNKPLDTSYIRTITTGFTYNKQILTADQKALIDMLNVGSSDPLYVYFDANNDNFPIYKSGTVTKTFTTPLDYMVYTDSCFTTGRNLVKNYAAAGNPVNATGLAMLNRIVSYRELSGYNGNKAEISGSTGGFTVGALAIGPELSMVVAPCELFDYYSANSSTNDWKDLASDKTGFGSYGTPLMMGYTNDAVGYVPNAAAYHYNGSYTVDGAQKYNAGTYETFNADFAEGTGEQLIDHYVKLLNVVNADTTLEIKTQCECGGKATNGEYGHVCKDIDFLPWTATDYLPTAGNYYLTADVTTTAQTNIIGNLCLDLNGHNITHAIAEGEIVKIGTAVDEQTRVFSLSGSAHLSITDTSVQTKGTIKRTVPADLTTEQEQNITNYGLLILLNGTSSAVLYDGVLDSTGRYGQGGTCISPLNAGTSFKMYGGTVKGGIANAYNSGLMYVCGSAELYGGTITGGTSTAGGFFPGIVVDGDGKLTIGGTVVIKNNIRNNGEGSQTNIRFSTQSKMAENFIVSGDFTGEAGVSFADTFAAANTVIGSSNNAAFTTGNLYPDHHPTLAIAVRGDDIVLLNESDIRNQCECGGKATDGVNGHTCKMIDFVPWTSPTSLPTHGNYYLTDNVTIANQLNLDGNLRLDLNGQTITRNVTTTTDPRVFAVNDGDYLSITDSSSTPGSVKRDVSNLSGTVTNWGLIVLITNGGNATLYNGHLDSTGGHTTGGGGCVSSNEPGANFTMYGGQLTGCTAGQGSVLYNQGTITIHDGTITGGTTSDTSNGGVLYNTSSGTVTINGGTFTGGKYNYGGFAYNAGQLNIFGGEIKDNRTVENTDGSPGVYCTATGKLTIGGDVVFENNQKYQTNGTVPMSSYIDIRFADPTKMATNFTVKGAFTGKAGFYVAESYRTEGWQIGVSDNASFTAENLYENYYSEKKDLAIDGNNNIIYAYDMSNFAATIVNGNTETPYETLSDAVNEYTGGDAVLTLQQNYIDETEVTFSDGTILDLNGCNLNSYVKANGTLTVKDSKTDDFSVKDDVYGKIPAYLAAEPAAGYVKITESDGVSFHKLYLEITDVTLRSNATGMYYTSSFGGDEVIQRHIVEFGVALGANEDPSFRPKTYTAFTNDTWSTNCIFTANGTVLTNILKEGNGYSLNMHNATAVITGAAYVTIQDDASTDPRRITDAEHNETPYTERTFKGMVEAVNTMDLTELNDVQRTDLFTMYQKYVNVMKNWDTDNIKEGVADARTTAC